LRKPVRLAHHGRMTIESLSDLPTACDIDEAAKRLHGVVVHTPLLRNPMLDRLTGGQVFLKAESLQLTGSFKFRGAFNMLSQIPPGRRRAGVVAFSSGNHAQGVAAAARRLDIPAVIVMPADAPLAKREGTAAYGAEIVLYDRNTEDREAIARAIAMQREAILVPPFDHPQIMAGQGTAGREIMDDLGELGLAPDVVLVPASGGGLMAGIALAVRARAPFARMVMVEPQGFDDHARSFASGRRERNERSSGSICDALMSTAPGELTFAVNRELIETVIAVDDHAVMEAMRFAFRNLRLVLEPGGAIALAALMMGLVDISNRVAVAVLSGGNVDARMFSGLIQEPA